MLDQAFEALKSYDWGTDRGALAPIDEAIVATQEDAGAREELETRLAAVLSTDVSRDAKDFVCRKLMAIGTAASVDSLSTLLPDPEMSHMGRYALERIPAPEAAQALRDALPQVSDALKVGILASLGVRAEDESVPVAAKLLGYENGAVAMAAARALGAIRSPAAADALASSKPNPVAAGSAVDAQLACAETHLAQGQAPQALVIYKRLAGGDQPKHVRLAATRGMLACAGKQD